MLAATAMTALRGRKWLTGSYDSAVIQRKPCVLNFDSRRADTFMLAGSRETSTRLLHVVEMHEWS
jgi:hypothetical protein